MVELTGEYDGIPFHRSPGPATGEDIALVESALSAELPADYKSLLSIANGCYLGRGALPGDSGEMQLDEWGFDVPPEMDFFSDVLNMAWMFGVGKEDNLLTRMTAYDFRERVPEGIVPIGDNLYDKFICLSVRREDYGVIYVWNIKEYWPPTPYRRDMRELVRVAGSFSQWWKSLRPVSQQEIDAPRRRVNRNGPHRLLDGVWSRVTDLFRDDPNPKSDFSRGD